MQTVTLTLDLPDDMASRFHALPAEKMRRYTAAALPDVIKAAEAAELDADYPKDTDVDDEPIDMAFVAELIAADEEYARTGKGTSISLEELEARMEAPDYLKRARAQLAAEGVTAAQLIGAPEARNPHN